MKHTSTTELSKAFLFLTAARALMVNLQITLLFHQRQEML